MKRLIGVVGVSTGPGLQPDGVGAVGGRGAEQTRERGMFASVCIHCDLHKATKKSLD